MEIKIIKCSKPTYWYSDKVGCVYKNIIIDEYYNNYRIKGYGFIELEDVEIINKNTDSDIFKKTISLFINEVPDKLIDDYLENEEKIYPLTTFILNNMKDEIKGWATGLSIIESVEFIIKEAISNGNLKINNNENK